MIEDALFTGGRVMLIAVGKGLPEDITTVFSVNEVRK